MVHVDPGSTISAISRALVDELSIPLAPTARSISLAGGHTVQDVPATIPEIVIRFKGTSVASRLLVLDLPVGTDALLGLDILPELGISVAGIFEADHSAHIADEIAMADLAKRERIARMSRGDEELDRRMRDRLAALIEANQAIPQDSHITHQSALASIPTTGQAFFRRPYPAREALRAPTSQVISDWLKTGIIFRRTTPTAYGSPLVVVPKRNAAGDVTGVRVCLDSRQLNAHFPADCHVDNLHNPTIDSILDFAAGHRLHATLDVSQAFLQIVLEERSRELTTFTWGAVQYSFQRLPFGVRHASSVCQRVITSVLAGTEEFCRVYTDDVLIVADSEEELTQRVEAVLCLFNKHKVRLSWPKCTLAASSILLLGHEVSAEGIGPNTLRCGAWRDAPAPSTVREVAALIGFAGYYRRLIPGFAKYETALSRVRTGKPRQPVTLSTEELAAWRGLAQAVDSAPLVEPFDAAHGQLEIYTDASVSGMGAVAVQREPNGKLHTIGFASRVLKNAEIRWSVPKLEAGALVFALRKFEPFLYGRHAICYTDNQALSYLATAKTLNRHAAAWFTLLSENDIELRHLPGAVNTVADALSRASPIVWGGGEPAGMGNRSPRARPLERPQASAADAADADFICAVDVLLDSDENVDFIIPVSDRTEDTMLPSDLTTPQSAVQFDRTVSTGTQTMFDWDDDTDSTTSDPGTAEARWQELLSAHELGHGGLRATLEVLRSRNKGWTGMYNDAQLLIGECASCIRNNIRRVGYHEPKARVAPRPGSEFVMDLMSLPPSDGYEAALVLCDAFSRLTLIEPLLDKRAATVAAAQWRAFSRLGLPDVVISDRGPEFRADLAREFARLLGHEHYFVVPRSPEQNGLAEAAVRRVRRVLRKLTDAGGSVGHGWPALTPQVEYMINGVTHSTTGLMPRSVHFGRRDNPPSDEPGVLLAARPRSAGADAEHAAERVKAAVEMVLPELRAEMQARADRARDSFSRTHHIVEQLNVGDQVVVERVAPPTNKQSVYIGPCRVAAVTRKGNYRLVDAKGRALARKFPIARLRLVRRDPTPTDGEEFEIERIVSHDTLTDGSMVYVVHWKDSDDAEDSLVPAREMLNAQDVLATYWQGLPTVDP